MVCSAVAGEVDRQPLHPPRKPESISGLVNHRGRPLSGSLRRPQLAPGFYHKPEVPGEASLAAEGILRL